MKLKPVAYRNNFTSVIWDSEQQPGAENEPEIYEPLVRLSDVLGLVAGNAELRAKLAIPEGWQLVPIEPTEHMFVCGFESEPDKFFSPRDVWEEYEAMSGCGQAAHRAKLCWAAMLSAAPKFGDEPDNQN